LSIESAPASGRRRPHHSKGNKLSIDHLRPYVVDGERGPQWIADRFSVLSTTANHAQH